MLRRHAIQYMTQLENTISVPVVDVPKCFTTPAELALGVNSKSSHKSYKDDWAR
jgi:hypothetical protein